MRVLWINRRVKTVCRLLHVLLLSCAVCPLSGAENHALPNLDRRAAGKALQPAASKARENGEVILRARLPGVAIDRDHIVGSPKWIATPKGFLTGPNGSGRGLEGAAAKLAALPANDPHRVVKAFVNEHAAVFGHDAGALERAHVKRDYVAEHSGLRTVSWEQRVDGIPVFGGNFKAHITRNGELVAMSSGFVPDAHAAADAAQRQFAANGVVPPISARQALLAAAVNLGSTLDLAQVQSVEPPADAEQRQKLSVPGWRRPARLALTWLPLNENSLRLCWRIEMAHPQDKVGYELFIDASTGEVWKRRCLTDDASPASYRVFTGESPTPLFPGYSTPSTSQPPVVARSLQTITSVNATASPKGWIDDGQNETRGNNTWTYYMKPTGPGSYMGETPEGSPSRVFDFPLDVTEDPLDYGAAAAVNAFYWVNFAHDRLHTLGFTEPRGNCQETNFNRGGLGDDSVRVTVQDPSSDDNAGMTTYSEGNSPEMDLGIFSGPEPDRDSALDATIIIHEYAHAMNQRLHEQNLDESQSRGMNEGWADFFALSLLASSSDNPNATYPKAAYSSLNLWGTSYDENYYAGIRRYPYSTDLTKNPLTFKDIDPDQASVHFGIPINPVLIGFPAWEVHMQGEVWCSMLWEARALLIAKHGATAGNNLMMQLVIDAMEVDPPNPNFIQARNAILLADAAMTGGANVKELWAAFAKRGLGVNATSPSSTTTVGVEENFDSLDDLLVTPSSGATIKGPVGGPFSPISRTFTLNNDGNASLSWRLHVDPPLQATIVGGIISAGGQQTVTVQLNLAAAGSLPEGVYLPEVRFTNITSGVVVERNYTLVVGLQNPPTEYFGGVLGDTNDLQFTTLTFTPTEDGTHYEVCKESDPTEFPTPTASAQTLTFGEDDDFVVRLLLGNAKIPFYGKNYSSLAIGEFGTVVFGGGHTGEFTDFPATLVNHFRVPRISPWLKTYSSLNATNHVSWQQLSNRVVVSWELTSGNFQLEMFFTGEIRFTFLNVSGTGVCGLSPGGGAPLLFTESNLSASPACEPVALSLKLPPSVTEGSGTVTGIVSVSRGVGSLTVNLSSSDTSEATVPASVLISGGTQVSFPIAVQNDALLDGTQVAYITASRLGYKSAVVQLPVHDNETAALSISISSSPTEGGPALIRHVTVSTPPAEMVTVKLSSSDTNELVTETAAAIIPAGQTSAQFKVKAVDDNRIDGTKSAIVTASVQNWTPGTRVINALDNESTNLMMSSMFFVNESMGTITNGGSVRLAGTLETNLLVGVFSDDESEVITPLFGVFVPAGETNVPFPLFIQDDAIVDGAIFVRLRAVANGFGPATNYIFVGDNDGPPDPFNPYPPHNSTNIPVTADLSWGRIEGDLIVNGSFETGDFSGWTLENGMASSFVINDGTFDPSSTDGPLPPFAGGFSALSQQLGAGQAAIYQDVFIPDGALSAVLTWRDRIRNHAGQFSSSQQFRVELRDPADNSVLATLFTTSTSTPLLNEWTNRTVSLNSWRGQTVRLAFVEEDGLGHMNVHLDDVSLIADSTGTTLFDVYFGTNNPPVNADFLGSTASATWPFALLAGGTDYYWQIKVRRSGFTNAGPVWHFKTEGLSATLTPIAFGALWRYRNTGQDLGTAWTNLNYNDNAWSSGVGRLGFGGGEDTTISGETSGFVTYYFRRKFTLNDTSRIATLTARLVRDDGALVWLNGRLAILDNMPSRGPWNYDTEAASAISGFDPVLVTHELNPAWLVEGTNIVAVEIHQFGGRPGFSGDLYFDLEMKGLLNIGFEAPAVTLTAPPETTQVKSPTNVLLSASVVDESVAGTTVRFYANNLQLGMDSTSPYAFTWTNPPPGNYALTAAATDSAGLSGTSAPVHLVVAPASGTMFSVVSAGGTWRYNNSGNDLGTAWRSRTYRDTDWAHGEAQLGYGDNDEATVIGFAFGRGTRPVTTYFRRTFSAGTNLTGFQLRVVRDDGAVVYLNGTEIFRNNMPAGGITSDTFASVGLSGAAENAWITTNLSSQIIAPLLLPSGNAIAVEIHQSSLNNTDLSFDLELLAIGNPPPTVAFASPTNGAVLISPASVPLVATALDPYGAISGVEFFADGTSLGSITSSPYQLPWNNPTLGVHTLTAVATDSANAYATSAPVMVVISGDVALRVQRSGAQVELTWPGNAEGFTVESATNLAPAILWSPVTNLVQITNGVFRVVVDPAESERYFRLKSP